MPRPPSPYAHPPRCALALHVHAPPPTGYRLYLYEGVGVQTVSNPEPVKLEIQTVAVSAAAQTAEVHRCNLANVVLSLKRMRLTASLHQVEWLAISRDLP